jgi:hypothetical protein
MKNSEKTPTLLTPEELKKVAGGTGPGDNFKPPRGHLDPGPRRPDHHGGNKGKR